MHFSQEDEKGGACSMYESNQKCVQNLVGKPEGLIPLGRSRPKRNLKGIWCEGIDWIQLAKDRAQ
jgi:hypothetical protein